MKGLKRQKEAEAKVKRMLDKDEVRARANVANAAATEGQRRSTYNMNNRFLITWWTISEPSSL